MYAVYIYYVYINTKTFMYIFQKNILHLCIKYIYISYNNINIYTVYIYIYIYIYILYSGRNKFVNPDFMNI